jgi:hypothetical protein
MGAWVCGGGVGKTAKPAFQRADVTSSELPRTLRTDVCHEGASRIYGLGCSAGTIFDVSPQVLEPPCNATVIEVQLPCGFHAASMHLEDHEQAARAHAGAFQSSNAVIFIG